MPPPSGDGTRHGDCPRALPHDRDTRTKQWSVATKVPQFANYGPFETAAQVLADDVLVHEAEIPSRPIPVSVLGHRDPFELSSRDGRLLALAECGGFAIILRATGEPPARLDLELFRHCLGESRRAPD